MRCEPELFPIHQLVSAWKDSSLKINSEYQRGATWKTTQKQGLIDSVFRRYPLPPVFLHKDSKPGLGGDVTVRYEIVDGQQRIRALVDYYGDKFMLLKPEDKQLRLPNSLRKVAAPWGGRKYSQLDSEQKSFLDEMKVNAFVLTEVENPDEIRDLFIRLQSGTALNRQQVRDAWPGNLGPYIERLAGKLDRSPEIGLFGIIDRRSDKGDDDVDGFTVNRQLCAQLLALFLARQRDPLAAQNLGADDLDRLYHSGTDFEPDGPAARSFKDSLEKTESIFLHASISNKAKRSKTKYKKMDVLAVFCLIQDLTVNKYLKLDTPSIAKIAQHVTKTQTQILPNKGKVSGRAILDYYHAWWKDLGASLGIRLDPQRAFDDSQKEQIFQRDAGKCGICANNVPAGEEEYDHFPTPHYLGGKTKIENGRLVCSGCHPRGRPVGS